jgi:hypothetical protein
MNRQEPPSHGPTTPRVRRVAARNRSDLRKVRVMTSNFEQASTARALIAAVEAGVPASSFDAVTEPRTVRVVGLGYVGLPTASALAESGIAAFCCDTSEPDMVEHDRARTPTSPEFVASVPEVHLFEVTGSGLRPDILFGDAS